jgi:hypothetical protein
MPELLNGLAQLRQLSFMLSLAGSLPFDGLARLSVQFVAQGVGCLAQLADLAVGLGQRLLDPFPLGDAPEFELVPQGIDARHQLAGFGPTHPGRLHHLLLAGRVPFIERIAQYLDGLAQLARFASRGIQVLPQTKELGLAFLPRRLLSVAAVPLVL